MTGAALRVAIVLAGLAAATTATAAPDFGEITMQENKSSITMERGAVVRGPRDRRVLAVQFTGGQYADGGTTILEELKKRGIKASFYFTGDFLRTPEFKPLIERIRDEGHYLGPHGDKHLLYASWEQPPKLLITREEFDSDLTANMQEIERFGIPKDKARFFNPAYQHYTREIADWTRARGMVLVNYSTGTLSHADYMLDDDPRYRSSEEMVRSVLEYEKQDPDGLNGFILHMHIGAGPGRTRDHLYNYLGGLLDELRRRGYSFVRVDELLKGL
ncbi:MAG: polysaccharide deacetylase family protein [Candidatus Sumerlaeaceae bacterium]|nr:polysaccharide deacetylase family protein [Candidatus Sumerlaeaceae bacterium]